MFECLDVWMFRCLDVKMFRCLDARMLTSHVRPWMCAPPKIVHMYIHISVYNVYQMMGAVVLRNRNGKCEMGMGIGMGIWVHGYPPAFRPFDALKPIENQFHLTKSQTNVCVASPNLQILFCIVSGPWPKDEGGGERGLRLAENF